MTRKMELGILAAGVLTLFFVVPALLFMWGFSPEEIIALAEGRPFLVGISFTLLMFIATVVAPITATPAIPVAAAFLHPALVGTLSVLGWTAGAVVAFVIARRWGRPLVARFVSLDEVARYERRVPARLNFFTLVLLRMVVPVDFLSYAIGLVSTIPLGTYTLATLIGVAPFSFIFAYGGSILIGGNFLLLAGMVVVGATVFALAWYMLRARGRAAVKEQGSDETQQ